MRTKALYVMLLPALCVAGTMGWKTMRVRSTASASTGTYLSSWSPAAAASYMDYREEWWESWPPTQKDHGTICVSCHTVVPYALARPALERMSGNKGIPAAEKTMLDSVEWRVGHWRNTTPFYSDADDGPGKTAESHSTEAVLNAVILATHDAGQGHLRPITRTALDEAWALQEEGGDSAGGWKWQNFGLAPWESSESGYQGAALLAVALGGAPDNYAGEPDVSKHLERLRAYLTRQYAEQPLMSQLYVLWASGRISGLLSETERTKMLVEIGNLQRSDGGWALSSLDEPTIWKRLKMSPKSDGCATGLVVLALEESGMSKQNKMLKRGLEWLEQHQEKDGSWRASSLNGQRDPESEVGRFMSDAATGYATLALEIANNGRRD